MSQTQKDASRKVLVTGGANGFGMETARALLAQGAQVAIGDIDKPQLEKATAELDNPNLLPLELDVSSKTSVQASVAACKENFGGLDALVNSAGVIQIAPLSEVTEEKWDWVINVDLRGVFLMSQAAAPLLSQCGRGRIVNIGSDASKIGFPQVHAYVAAKHGVAGLTKSLAGELASSKVTVNCVCPVGAPTTGMGEFVLSWKMDVTGLTPEEIMAATAADIPLKRNATEADIANAIMFFLADASDFLTGIVLDVDGGMLSTIPLPGAADA
jgi:NAD(P)-dependent dehydrogenase (short-subunit alcohol dehydrogenase family)|tara:strand:+ start:24643 stop:25455 length:813 start_codon:yes stop_codon:yes gene_type:complete